MIYFLNVSHILAKHLWFGEPFPKMYEMMLVVEFGGGFLMNQEPRGLLLGSLYPGKVSRNRLVVGEGQLNNSPKRNGSVNLSGEFLGPSS